MSGDREISGDLNRFAEAVAHELRTPLMAVAGEVELALRRNRSADDYREVLRRIAAGITVLVEITGDLRLLSDPVEPDQLRSSSSRLATILARIQKGYDAGAEVRIAIDSAVEACVCGDEQRLGRAIALVIEQAVRYRRGDAPVSLHVRAEPGRVALDIDALPSGFWPKAWSDLHTPIVDAAGPLRLRVARRILEQAGATLRTTRVTGTEVVTIDLPTHG